VSGPGEAAARRGEHEPFDELAVGWALHALEPEDETVFAAHLPGCARCARTVGEAADVLAAMAGDLPPARPPEGLRDRILAGVEQAEQVARPGPGARPEPPPPAPAPAPAPTPTPADVPVLGPVAVAFPDSALPPVPVGGPGAGTAWRRVLPSALVAAAVAVLLALGTWIVVLSTARDEATAAAAEQAEIVQSLLRPGEALVAPVDDSGGRPVATVVARDEQVQVVTHGLDLNDRDETTYVVWGLSDGPPVSLGTFDVQGPQMELQTVSSGATGADFTGFGVSLEPGREAPSAPTEIVARGQVTR
jgi:Anti-sigma-K factor rskA